MFGDQPVELGDALPLGRVFGEAFEEAGSEERRAMIAVAERMVR